MRTETIAYQADVLLTGTLFLPTTSGPVPGILIFPDIFEYGDHVLDGLSGWPPSDMSHWRPIFMASSRPSR